MSRDAKADLLAALDELHTLGHTERAGHRAGDHDSEAASAGEDAWIDPFVVGQPALDALGDAMRREATEADGGLRS